MMLIADLPTSSNDNNAYKSLVKGEVRRNGVSISCRVAVISRELNAILTKTISKPDGTFILHKSTNSSCAVIAIDPTNEFNIAAQDNVK